MIITKAKHRKPQPLRWYLSGFLSATVFFLVSVTVAVHLDGEAHASPVPAALSQPAPYPTPPKTCAEAYWSTLLTGQPRVELYTPYAVLADGVTRCSPPPWVRWVWWAVGRR